MPTTRNYRQMRAGVACLRMKENHSSRMGAWLYAGSLRGRELYYEYNRARRVLHNDAIVRNNYNYFYSSFN